MLGVVVAPKLARDVTPSVVSELSRDLGRRYGSVRWQIEFEVDPLVEPPASITEIFAAARRKLLEYDWDLGIVVTALPLRAGGRPVSHHPSPTHGIGIVSVPALGAVHLRHRLRRAVVELVGDLVGAADEQARGASLVARLRRRWERAVLRELASEVDDRPGGLRVFFVLTVLLGNLRLLVGMVRTNRPWRFAMRLYAALVAALVVAAFGVVTSDVWRLADASEWWRLAVMCVVSILATIVAVIGAHGLWERAPDRRVREQVVLFNVATAATVVVGIVTLYAALFALVLGGAALVVGPGVLERAVGHEVGFADYLFLAWFLASFATVGGALGAGLESDEAVREAAYVTSEADPEVA